MGDCYYFKPSYFVKQSINTDVKTFLLKKYESILDTKIHKMNLEKNRGNPETSTNPELESLPDTSQSMDIEENSNFTSVTRIGFQYTEEALQT